MRGPSSTPPGPAAHPRLGPSGSPGEHQRLDRRARRRPGRRARAQSPDRSRARRPRTSRHPRRRHARADRRPPSFPRCPPRRPPDSAILPPFVNAHVHLDSRTSGRARHDSAAGFVGFVDLVRSRRCQTDDDITTCVCAGIALSSRGRRGGGGIAGVPGDPRLAPWLAMADSPIRGRPATWSSSASGWASSAGNGRHGPRPRAGRRAGGPDHSPAGVLASASSPTPPTPSPNACTPTRPGPPSREPFPSARTWPKRPKNGPSSPSAGPRLGVSFSNAWASGMHSILVGPGPRAFARRASRRGVR